VFTYVAGCRQQYGTCSPACMFKYSNMRVRGINPPLLRSSFISITC
jgi:hypothetical protein